MSDEPRFVDAESYQGSGKLQGYSFREICLNQLSRLTVKHTVEWNGGYWNTRSRASAGGVMTDKWWVPDTREQFINGVNALHDILFPYFDKEMLEFSSSFYDEHGTLKKEKIKQAKNKEISADTLKTHLAEDYRKLYRALNLLLHRLQYLEGGSYEDDV